MPAISAFTFFSASLADVALTVEIGLPGNDILHMYVSSCAWAGADTARVQARKAAGVRFFPEFNNFVRIEFFMIFLIWIDLSP